MVDISQRITDNFPMTESTLSGSDDIDYSTLKTNAIASAKRAAYGTATIPAEADIPDLVGEWIGDKATVILIAPAIDFIMFKYPASKSNRQGETIRYPDKVQNLKGLRDELEADLTRNRPQVSDIIGRAASPQAVPVVSVAGMMIDPMARAMGRGIPS